MEQDFIEAPIELEIKAEPEQFESAVSIQQIEGFVKNENPAEADAVYIKVKETELPSEIEIIKFEPQASLKPIVVLKRLTDANIRRWTRWKHSKLIKPLKKFRCTCDVCGKTVSHRSALKMHLKIHFTSPHLLCDLCPKNFRYKKGLRIHMRSHLRNKPFSCSKCGFETIYRKSLVLHRSLHRSQRTECPQCQKMVTVLSTHIKRTHDRKDKEGQCKVCGKTMVVHKLARHTNLVHEKRKQCPNCNEKFDTRGLKIHMLRAHFKGKLHQCEECDAVFKSNLSLVSHSQVHSGEATCGVCSRNYSGLNSLKRHWNDKHRDSLGSYTEWKKNNK